MNDEDRLKELRALTEQIQQLQQLRDAAGAIIVKLNDRIARSTALIQGDLRPHIPAIDRRKHPRA